MAQVDQGAGGVTSSLEVFKNRADVAPRDIGLKVDLVGLDDLRSLFQPLMILSH